MIDTLTKIPTLQVLEEKLSSTDHPKLFLLDIKDFKKINLDFTDQGGDFVLCSFANALEEFASQNEMSAFRVEEDTFALLKDTPFDLTAMEKLVFSMVDFINYQKYDFNGHTIDLKANIGICFDYGKTFNKAKAALELAKAKDQPFMTYSEFAKNLLEESEEQISKAVEESVKNGDVKPYFQRVIDLNGNSIYNEVLVRIILDNSVQSPKFFLDISHERGFYNDIVKSYTSQLQEVYGKKGLNFSCSDFASDELFNYLIETFKDTNTIFELQSNKCLLDSKTKEKLSTLKANGIKICIDNITNAEVIQHFQTDEIDLVKVSGDLIRLLGLSDEAQATCKEILAVAKEHDIKTVATHINSNATFEEAKKLDFDYYQGFFFGKPTQEFNY